MSENEIGRITVYRLNLDDIEEISFDDFVLVKIGTISTESKKKAIAPQKVNTCSYRLFFLKQHPLETNWYKVFKELNLNIDKQDIPKTLKSGFILLVNLNDESYYGVTGGVGHYYLKETCEIEHRFGIEIAEAILSLPELRGLVQKDTSGEVYYLNRVFRGQYNPQGDIDNLKRVLTNVRGTLKKDSEHYDKIGRSIQASDALSVNGKKDFLGILNFLLRVERLRKSGSKSITIPQLAHITKKYDAALLEELENELVSTLCNFQSGSTYSLFLDNEEIGYLPDRITEYRLIYDGVSHPLSTYEDVFDKVKELLLLEDISERVEKLNHMTLEVTFDDDAKESNKLKYFICGDIEYKNNVFFINNKYWYRTSEDFINRLDDELDNIEYIMAEHLALIDWDPKRFKGQMAENDFNKENKSFQCLDRHLVKIQVQKGNIEFCDLLRDEGDELYLVHVKQESGAALRALFAQVFVSSKLYAESQEFRDKVHSGDLTGDESTVKGLQPLLEKLSDRRKREFKIIIAIHDNQPSHKVIKKAKTTSQYLNGTLTTFAKVDLLDRVKAIRSMGYGVAVTRIKPFPEAK